MSALVKEIILHQQMNGGINHWVKLSLPVNMGLDQEKNSNSIRSFVIPVLGYVSCKPLQY